ncbi:universal stress protein [Kitasatospora sp. NPDC050543]|uniref:universal stress protein n=1 Tax=Kitasatospora sp. NPDC050543 TaxID=3364054 RepID=UPI003791A8ED
MNHSVVVGIDGSAQSAAAARWAAEEARRSGRALRMVHVVDEEGGALARTGQPVDRLPRSVTAIRDRIAAVLPELEIACERIPGSPAYALAAAGERGGLLVLGSRGLGGFTGLLVGSVGLRTAAHAGCPVVLVRDDADGTAGSRGEVVVGVRGDRPCDAVLAFAFDQAVRRGAVLRAVEARTSPAGPYATQAPLDQRSIRESLATARLVHLQDALGRWREKFPEVRTQAEVVGRGAADALLEASRGASLVVLGRRAPGHPMATPRLGAVAHAVLHHAHGPVAVVPHD